MGLVNKKDASGKIESKEDRSKIYQMIVDRGLPGERILWKPSPTREYDLYVQILSDKERQAQVNQAVQSLKGSGFKHEDVSEQVYQERYAEEVAAHMLLLALREGNDSSAIPGKVVHRIIFRSVDELRSALTTDEITTLFRYYVGVLEKDSPSYHYLSQIEDFDKFVKDLLEEADGSIPLVLQSMPSQALAELLVGMARHFMNPSQLKPLPNTSEFQLENSIQGTLSSTELASKKSEEISQEPLNQEQLEAMAKGIK